MKPCSSNRKQLALLAADALDPRRAEDLRAHLEACEGCRRYLADISTLTQELSAVEINSEIQTCDAFHQKVIKQVRAERSPSIWEIAIAQLSEALPNWRIALPATAVLCLALLFMVWRGTNRPTEPLTASVAPSAPVSKPDLSPTFANYQMVANQSLEMFDELLTRQGSRIPFASQTYAAFKTED